MEQKNNFPIHYCISTDAIFPPSLRYIPSAPHKLYYRGDIQSTPRIAIVGTRRASLEGKKLAYHIAYELALNHWCIVSGLAFGIDTAAHQGACAAQGITWAVLAHGLDTIQPKHNVKLAQEIVSTQGCLLSEYSPGTPPYPHQFLARNRIISGVSNALIVIEAPQASGSLATARAAIQQGIPVFVFPGPSSSSLYVGSHELIRNGARLVRNIKDLYTDLTAHPQLAGIIPTEFNSLTPIQTSVLSYIRQVSKPIPLDSIIEKLHISYQEAQAILIILLEKRYIREIGPQLYTHIV
ncbi:MAG: DNA-processing protein DprA [Candidatus Paceibacterota bacterium]